MRSGRDGANVVQACACLDRWIAEGLLSANDLVAFIEIDAENLNFRRAAGAEKHAIPLVRDVEGTDRDFIPAKGSSVVGRRVVAIVNGRARLVVIDGSVVVLGKLQIGAISVAIVPKTFDGLSDAAVVGLGKIARKCIRVVCKRDAARNRHGVMAVDERRQRIARGDAVGAYYFE